MLHTFTIKCFAFFMEMMRYLTHTVPFYQSRVFLRGSGTYSMLVYHLSFRILTEDLCRVYSSITNLYCNETRSYCLSTGEDHTYCPHNSLTFTQSIHQVISGLKCILVVRSGILWTCWNVSNTCAFFYNDVGKQTYACGFDSTKKIVNNRAAFIIVQMFNLYEC